MPYHDLDLDCYVKPLGLKEFYPEVSSREAHSRSLY